MGPSRRAISIPVALLLLLAQTRPLQAQFGRPGFWLSAGPGYGSASGPNGRGMGGFSGSVAAGWTLSPKVQLGLGVAGWTKSGPAEAGTRLTMRIGTVDARIRFYADPRRFRFFFTGGFGLGFMHFFDDNGGASRHTGIGILGGAGYDIQLTPAVSLSPFANYYIVRTSDPRADVAQVGLALTVY